MTNTTKMYTRYNTTRVHSCTRSRSRSSTGYTTHVYTVDRYSSMYNTKINQTGLRGFTVFCSKMRVKYLNLDIYKVNNTGIQYMYKDTIFQVFYSNSVVANF